MGLLIMKFGNAIDVSLFLKEKLESDLEVKCVIARLATIQEMEAGKDNICIGIYPASGSFEYEPEIETEKIHFIFFVMGKNTRIPDRDFLEEITSAVLQTAMRTKDILNSISPAGNIKNVMVSEWEMIEHDMADALCVCKLVAQIEIVRPRPIVTKEDYYA